jgi:hypothetical protein
MPSGRPIPAHTPESSYRTPPHHRLTSAAPTGGAPWWPAGPSPPSSHVRCMVMGKFPSRTPPPPFSPTHSLPLSYFPCSSQATSMTSLKPPPRLAFHPQETPYSEESRCLLVLSRACFARHRRRSAIGIRQS